MPKRLVILQDGKRFVWTDRLTITEHGNPIVKEIDLTHATWHEMEHLKRNPDDEVMLTTIQSRKKDVKLR